MMRTMKKLFMFGLLWGGALLIFSLDFAVQAPQVKAGERTRIQVRMRNRKRIRQQKGKRQHNGRQAGVQSLGETQQKPAAAENPPPKTARTEKKPVPGENTAMKTTLTDRLETYIQKRAKETETDRISVCKAAVSALNENKEEASYPELFKEISDYSQKNTVSPEIAKGEVLNRLRKMISGYEAELQQKRLQNPSNGTLPRHNRTPRVRKRRSKK